MKNRTCVLVCVVLGLGLLLGFAGTVMAQGPSHEGGLGEQKIMLNLAEAETLAKGQGMTESLAEAIVEYRESKGYFKKPEDLMKVPGITKAVYDKIDPKQGAEGELYLLLREGEELDDEVPALAPSKC
jgi:competence ComEA-like helix-hairpin-helix protein